MKVRWTPQAADELEEISEYLWRERPGLAQSTIQKLYSGAQSLGVCRCAVISERSREQSSFFCFHCRTSSSTGFMPRLLRFLGSGIHRAMWWCISRLSEGFFDHVSQIAV